MLRKIISFIVLIAAFVTLIGLGYWQVQRLQWKNDIIARLDAEYQKTDNEFSFHDLSNLQDDTLPLKYGRVEGRYIFDKQIFLGPKPHEGDIGFDVITVLQFKTGDYILVNRGWVEKDNLEKIKTNEAAEPHNVTGILRKPDWNRFTPNNSPQNNVWSKADIQQIANFMKLAPIAPVILYASSQDNPLVIAHEEKWYPRNKHLQYAIFWFSMALVLVVVFGIYSRKK